MAALAFHTVLMGAAISGTIRGPVHAIILAVGDKGAHTLAGFVLVLPALLLLRRSGRAWFVAALVAVTVLPVAWESPILGLSLVYDAGDVLANFAGAVLAVLVSGVAHRVLRPSDLVLGISLLRSARRAGPVLVASLLFASTFAAVAAFEGSVALPRGATRTFPETGFLDVVEGQAINWSWDSDYTNFWWEEESRGTFSGGDTFGAEGCWYVDVPASLRIVWANTADPPPDTVVNVVNYSIDVVNGTGGPSPACSPLSPDLALARPPGLQGWQIAVIASLVVAAVAIPLVWWWRTMKRAPRAPQEPPPSPPFR